jgi:hypothetical protein
MVVLSLEIHAWRPGMKMRSSIVNGLAIAIGLSFVVASAQAAAIETRGDTIQISGVIFPGDDLKFRDVLAASPGAAIVRLNSQGGNILASGRIGRQIRAGRLTTLVDAASGVCNSACTVIFTSGVQRVYLHASAQTNLHARGAPTGGLGFHQGSMLLAGNAHSFSGAATGEMVGFFYEFGVQGAVGLLDKASPDQMYTLSGPEALSLGVATK